MRYSLHEAHEVRNEGEGKEKRKMSEKSYQQQTERRHMGKEFGVQSESRYRMAGQGATSSSEPQSRKER